jgi:hypothetical protein
MQKNKEMSPGTVVLALSNQQEKKHRYENAWE